MRPPQYIPALTCVYTCTHLHGCDFTHNPARMHLYTCAHNCKHPHAHTSTCTHPHRTSGQGWSEKGVSPRLPELPFSPEPLHPQLTGLEPQQEGVGLQTRVGKSQSDLKTGATVNMYRSLYCAWRKFTSYTGHFSLGHHNLLLIQTLQLLLLLSMGNRA